MNAAVQAVSALFESAADDGGHPVWVQVASGGTYKGYAGGEGEFTFDFGLFTQVVANFRRHPSYRRVGNIGGADVIAWDFHHASEMPAAQVGRDGAPAQGWILELDARLAPDGTAQLWALTRWLEPARSYIKAGRYKWASVSVLFDGVDAVTGQRIGAVLTSVALTNQPFIEGMQPLAASRNAPAHSPKEPNMTDLEKRIIERVRVLRAEIPEPHLALTRATAELMPTATNDERYRVWRPLLQQHRLEEMRRTIGGAQLANAPTLQARAVAPSVGNDSRPTLDVSMQSGPNLFAKLLAHVKASSRGKSHNECFLIACHLRDTRNIIT